MMDSETAAPEAVHDGKLRERLDFSQWVLDHMEKMSDVQAIPDQKAYENMLNTLIFRLSPWWPDKFKEKLEKARMKFSTNPTNKLNRERLEDKEMLLAELLDITGIAFTRRKKAKIKGGLKRLWEEFPPFPPEKENSPPNKEE